MSLCFDEAYEALRSERITEDEYLHHALAHFCGVRHPADQIGTRSWESMICDPVGNAIREAALNSPSTKIESVSHLERVFASALNDDAQSVRTLILQLGQRAGVSPPLQAIATFAALHNDAAVLKLCLQMGASLDDKNTVRALEFAARSPALLDVLYENNWREMRLSRHAFDRMAEWSLHTCPQELGWFLERGANVDRTMLCRATQSTPLKASCVALLVQRFGADLFQETRVLQDAARRGQDDIVKILLDADFPVDEAVSLRVGGSRDVAMTALYEAVDRQHEETVALLLDFGADPEKAVSALGAYNTPLRLAEGREYARIQALLRRSVDKHRPGARVYTSRL